MLKRRKPLTDPTDVSGIKVKKIDSRKRKSRRMAPTETLRVIWRSFIDPFIRTIDKNMSMSEGVRLFFQVQTRGCYFRKAKKPFVLPGDGWTVSPNHSRIRNPPSHVKPGDLLTVRVDYETDFVEVEFNEVVFTLSREQYAKIHKKMITL